MTELDKLDLTKVDLLPIDRELPYQKNISPIYVPRVFNVSCLSIINSFYFLQFNS
jgi:hypothetical protein